MNVDELSLHFVLEHPGDAARALEDLPIEEIAGFLGRLPEVSAGNLLALLPPQLAAACLAAQQPAVATAILAPLKTDLAAMLLRRIEPVARYQFLSNLPAARAAALRLALRYPEAVVGSVLDPDVLAFPRDTLVQTVIDAVRVRADALPDHIYVVDQGGGLAGVVDVKTLLVADADGRVGGLADPPRHVFSARASLLSVYGDAAWQDLRSVPVIDRSGLLLGSVSHDSVSKYYAATGETPQPAVSDLADLMYALAETVWDACAEIFVRSENHNQKTRSGT